MPLCEICGNPKSSTDICEICGTRVAVARAENLEKLKLFDKRAALRKKILRFIATGALVKIGILVALAGVIIAVAAALLFIMFHQAILLPP
ncbi:MAG: hypothetical protein QMD21_06920 [Candidatus Thermoplasmatota archaeon]|nr:hypothetical protein [Candidatus Thermoplasmatota archaeon]MDI6856491.1 hypothetical protein [Candidatus Thermoplasmatota archaeon]